MTREQLQRDPRLDQKVLWDMLKLAAHNEKSCRHEINDSLYVLKCKLYEYLEDYLRIGLSEDSETRQAIDLQNALSGLQSMVSDYAFELSKQLESWKLFHAFPSVVEEYIK